MKKLTHAFLLGAVLLGSTAVIAQQREAGGTNGDPANRAVNINLGSTGGALDNSALVTIRRQVGKAISSEAVDTFIVYSPRIGGPVQIEGGLNACAEEGFSAKPNQFREFVHKLREIRPRAGTFLNVELTDQCKPVGSGAGEGNVCGGIAGKRCPEGKTCVDDPSDDCDPKRGGADCPGICKGRQPR